MQMRFVFIVLGLAGFFSYLIPAFSRDESSIQNLPALGADPSKVSVSGLSSGAFMAVQYDVAFSASTIGAGIVAGGPYNCAHVNTGSIEACTAGLPAPPSGEASVAAARGFATLGQIDSIDHLASQKIYMFSGTKDHVVTQSVMDAVESFYRGVSVPPANIEYVKGLPAGHAFIAPGFGNACDSSATPYVNRCILNGAPYDQPEAILAQMYGQLQPEATRLSAQPVAFNQRQFASTLSGLADTGYVYIPTSCKNGSVKCAVHVVFHGCKQGVSQVGDDIFSKLGYNNWADTNHIIVLYPQVSESKVPYNPEGCWDWWGYSGLNFPTQGGIQLTAVHAMIQRLLSQ
jgi:poly(3-hydroxybutyrate) depolymerase